MPSLSSLCLAGLVACVSLAAGSRTETRTEALKAGGSLLVRTHNSPITVEGWDRDELSLSAEIQDSRDYPVKVELRRIEGRLEVEAIFPEDGHWWGGSKGACAFTLKVPRRLSAEFRTGNAQIQAKGLEGRLEFRTSNAALLLEDLKGTVEARTSNGSVRARRVEAALRGATSNGSLSFESVTGPLDFSTSNGSIRAQGLGGQGKGIRLSTSNGSITVDLGEAKGLITANTSRHEKVRVERSGVELVQMNSTSELRLKVPGSDQAIDLHTSNGPITIR